MCSIFALLGYAGSETAARDLALGQSRLLRHRGPDWSGLYADERVVLAHERLAIVGVDSGAQPLRSPDGRQLLAVNGEIYNHLELRREYEADYAFQTHSDCEVLLPMWRARGADFVNELNGIFAFVLYDSETGDWLIGRDPIGVIASIAPWNYPLLMAAWKLAPALAAGNTVVIKPSENTPLSLLAFARILGEILPKGVVNVICGNGPDVGQRLITHDLVRMISLTGDVRTGRAILKAAAGDTIKRTHLELGGKAPVIVLKDADLDVVVSTMREACWQ